VPRFVEIEELTNVWNCIRFNRSDNKTILYEDKEISMPHSLKLMAKSTEKAKFAYEDLRDQFPKQVLRNKKEPDLIGDSRKDSIWKDYRYQKTLVLSRAGASSFDEAEKKASEMAAYLRIFGKVLVLTDGAQGCTGHRDNYVATFVLG
jgi:hypothetical protein